MARSMLDWPEEADLTVAERARLLSAYDEHDDVTFERAAIERYRKKPIKALSSWFVRYRFLWIGTRTAFTPPLSWASWFAYKSSLWLLNFCVLLFGLVGGVSALRGRTAEVVLLIPIAYVAIVYLPFHSTEPRYTLIAIPFLLALATPAVALLHQSRPIRNFTRPGALAREDRHLGERW